MRSEHVALIVMLAMSAQAQAAETITSVRLNGHAFEVPVTDGLIISLLPEGRRYYFNSAAQRERWFAQFSYDDATVGPAVEFFDYRSSNGQCGMPATLVELCDLSGITLSVAIRRVSINAAPMAPSTYGPVQPSAQDTNDFQTWATPEMGGLQKALCSKISATSTLCNQPVFVANWVNFRVWFAYTGSVPSANDRQSVMLKVTQELSRFIKLN